jgi:hypothetical protein
VFVVYCVAEALRWPWDERVEHHEPPSRCNGGRTIVIPDFILREYGTMAFVGYLALFPVALVAWAYVLDAMRSGKK